MAHTPFDTKKSGSDIIHTFGKRDKKKNVYLKSVYNPEQYILWWVRFDEP